MTKNTVLLTIISPHVPLDVRAGVGIALFGRMSRFLDLEETRAATRSLELTINASIVSYIFNLRSFNPKVDYYTTLVFKGNLPGMFTGNLS